MDLKKIEKKYEQIIQMSNFIGEIDVNTKNAIFHSISMGQWEYTIRYDDEEKLRELVNKASSSASISYGKPFFEIFKEVDYDFRRIDPDLFAPAVLIINNTATGNTFKAGSVNSEVFRQSIGL